MWLQKEPFVREYNSVETELTTKHKPCGAYESHVSQEDFISVLTESRTKTKGENHIICGFC